MIPTLLESLRQWNKAHDDRTKLQHALFVLTIILVVIAGLASLLNVDLGRQILAFASVAGAVFLINAIGWVLLQAFILSRIASVRKPTSKK